MLGEDMMIMAITTIDVHGMSTCGENMNGSGEIMTVNGGTIAMIGTGVENTGECGMIGMIGTMQTKANSMFMYRMTHLTLISTDNNKWL
jgi:hypothetical protein